MNEKKKEGEVEKSESARGTAEEKHALSPPLPLFFYLQVVIQLVRHAVQDHGLDVLLNEEGEEGREREHERTKGMGIKSLLSLHSPGTGPPGSS